MLTEGDLQSMRATLDRTLPGTAIIQRRTFSADGQGGGTEIWAAVGTVDCRLSPIPAGERAEFERAGSMAERRDRVVTVPDGTDIEGKDRVVIASVTYEVSHVDGPRTYEIDRRVDVTEVK